MLPYNHSHAPAFGKLGIDFPGDFRNCAAEQDQIIGQPLTMSE
jgi:hypothetical protein